jgi:putative hemolysin
LPRHPPAVTRFQPPIFPEAPAVFFALEKIFMVSQILLLCFFLVLSGFFSSSETALFSISKVKAIHLAKDGGKTGMLIRKMKEDPHKLLSTILIGNNVVNVGASALMTAVTMKLVASHAVGIATGIMTMLILVFGEIFPKSLATRNNILIAKLVIFPIYYLSVIFTPLIIFLNFIPRITGRMRLKPSATEEELLTFVEVVEEEGEIKEEERELIRNIFQFDDTYASEIMTPRADMFVINADQQPELEIVVKSGFSRFPVIEGDIDHVVGIITIKDLFLHKIISTEPCRIRDIMTEPIFVPEFKKLDSLFHQLKERKQHIAIVVDEHGGVSGLITMEDVIEEIVGDISDETDKVEQLIVKISPDEWKVRGKTDIDEINEKTPMNIPDSWEFDTFSGYILNTIGKIPEEKEEIQIGRFSVTVNKKVGNRIEEYIIRKNDSAS